MWIRCAILLWATGLAASRATDFTYVISKTWNGEVLPLEDRVTMKLRGIPNSGDIEIQIEAPFYNDPPPEGTPFAPLIGLWNHEVVEAFFLNDDNQYLEVELGPYGHYIVILLNGERNTVRHSLPMEVSAEIIGNKWIGTMTIPVAYLPPKVTKFNAYSINGVGEDRKYYSLYPTDGTTAEPDFHNLNFFRPINMAKLSPIARNKPISLLWETAVDGIIPFVFEKTWRNTDTNLPPTVVTLQGFKGGVEMNYTVPKAALGKKFKSLQISFGNNEGQVLRLSLAVDGTFNVDLLKDRDVVLQGKRLALDSIYSELDTSITGSLLIPPNYFPMKVRHLSLFSIFEHGNGRTVLSLQPLSDDDLNKVNQLDMNSELYDIPIDIDFLLEDNTQQPEIWEQRLAAAAAATATTNRAAMRKTPVGSQALPFQGRNAQDHRSLDDSLKTSNTFTETDEKKNTEKEEDMSFIPIGEFLEENLPESMISDIESVVAELEDAEMTTEAAILADSPEAEPINARVPPHNMQDLSSRSIAPVRATGLKPNRIPIPEKITTEKITTEKIETTKKPIILVPTPPPTLGPWPGLTKKSDVTTPRPHPVCYGEGLVPNPHRCQVFHECALVDGQWEMYNWRCIRGRRFDPDKVECVIGIC